MHESPVYSVAGSQASSRYGYKNSTHIRLCIDVPFTDHPYLIGPRGRKCQQVMEKHKCLIHFPDVNRKLKGPKLNHVMIYASAKHAEDARQVIRDRTPIRLTIKLSSFTDGRERMTKLEEMITEHSLPINWRTSENYSNCVLKAEWRSEATLIQLCDTFFNRTPDCSEEVPFMMVMPLLPLINPGNTEISNRLIEYIHRRTGCQIFYPPQERFVCQPPSYFIKGSTAASVISAGKHLIGLTVLQVNFDVPRPFALDQNKVNQWRRDLHVDVSVENKDNSTSLQQVVLRSFEFAINNVYFVRSVILEHRTLIKSSAYNFMQDVHYFIPSNVFEVCKLYFPQKPFDLDPTGIAELSSQQIYANFYNIPLPKNWMISGQNFLNAPIRDNRIRPNDRSPKDTNNNTPIATSSTFGFSYPRKANNRRSTIASDDTVQGGYRRNLTGSPLNYQHQRPKTYRRTRDSNLSDHNNDPQSNVARLDSIQDGTEPSNQVFVMTKDGHHSNESVNMVMVDPAKISIGLAASIEIFQLLDKKRGDRRILVGYCMHADVYQTYVGEPSQSRLIKMMPNFLIEPRMRLIQHLPYIPHLVCPINDDEFYKMLSSPYTPSYASQPPNGMSCSTTESALQLVNQKFQLAFNENLIPMRLPDGLSCYMRIGAYAYPKSDPYATLNYYRKM